MKGELYTLLYFSPTGNARHLAEVLADHLGRERSILFALETVEPEQLGGGGHLVLLYPIHSFNPPRNVERFVKRLPPGLFRRVSLIAVGCTDNWVNWAASYRLRWALIRKGYAIGLEEILAMPLTIFMAFPDELARRLVAESERRVKEIADFLDSGRSVILRVPWRSRVVSFLGRIESLASRFFGLELQANGKCVSCGMCWNHCPQRNIRPGRGSRPRFGFNCLMCMRCIYNCPEGAIAPRFSKFIPIKEGYSLSRYTQPIAL